MLVFASRTMRTVTIVLLLLFFASRTMRTVTIACVAALLLCCFRPQCDASPVRRSAGLSCIVNSSAVSVKQTLSHLQCSKPRSPLPPRKTNKQTTPTTAINKQQQQQRNQKPINQTKTKTSKQDRLICFYLVALLPPPPTPTPHPLALAILLLLPNTNKILLLTHTHAHTRTHARTHARTHVPAPRNTTFTCAHIIMRSFQLQNKHHPVAIPLCRRKHVFVLFTISDYRLSLSLPPSLSLFRRTWCNTKLAIGKSMHTTYILI